VDDARVIVARTFSKVYGLAGLRLGYGIAAQKTISRMKLYLTQDSINGLVVKAAATALADKAGTDQAIRRNAAEREEFFRQANARRLRPIDSHTNFVMMQVHRPAGEVIDDFGKRNILIGRRFPPLDNYVRVSLGTAEEMRQFWRVWDSLPYGNAHWEPKQSRCPPACVG
jgi:histidinol-phosphate aminotransferase